MGILDSLKKKLGTKNEYAVTEKVEDSSFFDELAYVERLCEKSIQLEKMKAKKQHTIKHYEETLNSIDTYEKIDDNTMKRIDTLMSEYNTLKNNKDNLKNHILENGKKYEHLSHFSYQEIENEIATMKEMEKEHDILKRDLDHLRSEKSDILQNSEQTEKVHQIVRGLMYFTIFAASLMIITFVILFSVMQESIIMPASVTTVIMIFWTTWLYIFNNKLYNDLLKFRKLQAREIQLSNGVKLGYVDLSNALDYKYKKFNTRSADALKYEWTKYQETLDKKYTYNKVFHEFFDIEEQLQELLTSRGIIFDEDISMIEIISNIKEKLRFKTDMHHKINAIMCELGTMEMEQKKIKESLNNMEKHDKTEQKVVKNVIESYFKGLDQVEEDEKNEE